MILLILASILSAVIGVLAVHIFYPFKEKRVVENLGRMALALCLGIALSSSMWFLCELVVKDASAASLFVADGALAIILCVVAVMVSRKQRPAVSDDVLAADVLAADVLAAEPLFPHARKLLLGAALLSLVLFVVTIMHSPWGGWDALMIWNLRSVFLFRAGANWPVVFSNDLFWSHPDYPLLVPGSVARLWDYAGQELQLAPTLIALTFVVSTAALLWSVTSTVRSRNAAAIAVLMLLSTPYFITCGASQLADVPLGFYILGALGLLVVYDGPVNNKWLLVLSGLLAGCAAWTKNEGVLFVPALLAGRFLVVAGTQGPGNAIRQCLLLVAGMLPFLATIAAFKSIAPSNDIVGDMSGENAFAHLFDVNRYLIAARYFGIYGILWGRWLVSPIPLLLVYWLCIPNKRPVRGNVQLMSLTTVLVFMLVGYFMVYVLLPQPTPVMAQRLEYSLDRLMAGLWPSLLLWFFCIVPTGVPAVQKQAEPASP